MLEVALSLFSCSLLALSVRYPALGWLALVGFLPMLEAIWRERSPWKAALYSSVAFAGAPLAGYEGAALHSWPGLFALMLCIAVLFTIPGAFLRLGFDTLGQHALVGFPLLWVATEQLPASINTFAELANPFVQIGYSQSQTSLLHLAALGGVPLVSLVVMGINMLVYSAFRLANVHRIAAVGAAGAALLLPAVLPLMREGQDNTLARPIAVVQVAPTPDEFLLAYHGALGDELLDRYLNQTRQLLKQRPRPSLILWPESANLKNIRFNQSPESDAFRNQLKRLDWQDTTLLFGTSAWLDRQEYNVVMSYSANNPHPDTPFELVYAKHLLMPFIETSWATPGDQSGTLLTFPNTHVVASGLASSESFIAAPFICIETLHPDLIRPLVRQGAEILLFPSSNMWAEHTRVGYMHYLTSIFRAVEFHRTVYLAAQYGPSAIISPGGHVQALLPMERPGALSIRPRVSHVLTPFVQYGSGLRAVFLLLSGMFCVVVLVLKIRGEGVRSPTILPS
jgi:apolipoprotein N-acyltransferase